MDFDVTFTNTNCNLRQAREERGWSQRRVAEQIGTTEDVVSSWERNIRKPGPYYREKLCQLFQKNAYELGFIQGQYTARANQERFTFGKIPTTWIVIDGNGTQCYQQQDITSFFENSPQKLPSELQERKEKIARQQLENRKRGLPFHWNGQRYSLSRFIISREGVEERPALDLWFSHSDYYTFLATNMGLNDQRLREKYLKKSDWSVPVPFFSNSFGVQLVVRTLDNAILLTQRAPSIGIFPGAYSVSMCEGMGIMDAHSNADQAPSLYSCATRGLHEELGLKISEDFNTEDIQFLSFGVDSWYSQWALLGTVKIQKTAETVLNYLKTGVKDRRENAQIYIIPFDIDKIIEFIFEHQTWIPGSLACLYHTLIQELDTRIVHEAIARHALRYSK